MDSVRYYVALVVFVGLPPALMFWFFVHPFASFWRRLGAGWTYAIAGIGIATAAAALSSFRQPVLDTEYGTSVVTTALAVPCFVGALILQFMRSKHLTLRILLGLPEVSSGPLEQGLLTEGIYARIRHPRYMEALLYMIGCTLFANYLALYVMTVLCFPVGFAVVLLEERELRARFGAKYVEYCRRVPRFIPRKV